MSTGILRSKLIPGLFVLICICALCFYWKEHILTKTQLASELLKVGVSKNKDGEPKLKLILLWSATCVDAANRWHRIDKIGHEGFVENKCKHQNCNITIDVAELQRADVVVFLDNKLGTGWPEIRYPHQLYVHLLTERPGPWHQWLGDYDDKINVSMNYRQDADIHYNWLGYHERDEALPGSYVIKYPMRNKTGDVAWAVSHCNAESKRDDYAAELAKYISVDVYGECGNLTCPIRHKCREFLEKDYKFYLAFENVMCDGYATEKVFAYMDFELVPIVLGKFDYKKGTPPHSVIDIRDYASPKELAKYLKYLSSNETAYYEYFQWKQKYEVPSSKQSMYCALCDGINDPKFAKGVPAGGYYNWWFGACDNEYIDRMRAKGGW
jgi:hypothetical protein